MECSIFTFNDINNQKLELFINQDKIYIGESNDDVFVSIISISINDWNKISKFIDSQIKLF